MATRTSPPKGLLVAGVVALLVGLGGCGGGLYGCTSFVAKLIAVIESSEPVPFAEAYRFTAEGENAWVLTSAEANCEATDATGSAVALSEPPEGVDQSYTVGDDGYDAAYAFDTVVGRGYEVICNGNAPAGEFLVVPLPGGLSNLKVGVGATVGGGALMVAGVGLTIAGIVQRSRWRRNGGAAGAVVPTSVGAPPPVPPPGPPTAPPSVPPAASPTVPPTGPPTVPPAGPPAAPPTGPTDQ